MEGSMRIEEVEAQYCASPFVREICVFPLTADEKDSPERLYAVVVPDMARMRQRRIVNVGEVIRFEMEGQSIHLPTEERVAGYEISFVPLPRAASGGVDRQKVARWFRERTGADGEAASQPVAAWGTNSHVQEALSIIRRGGAAAHISQAANLEIDLGIDSIARVELIAALEARFGTRVAPETAHEILTVGQLIDAVRPSSDRPRVRAADMTWGALLRDVTPADDDLVPLLQRRWFAPLLVFVMLRAARFLFPRIVVSGLEHLPQTGPFILTPNHQSYLDPFFICSVLPFRVFRRIFVVGAPEYFETPVTRWAARQLHLVAVDPDANLVPAMKAAAFGLSHGRILLLFPEGERSIDGTVKRFKKGAAILAYHGSVPIVPVAVRGLFELWPRNRPFAWRRLRLWSRHVVRVAFGPPVTIDTPASTVAAERVRMVVASMWEALASGDAAMQHKTMSRP